jgi:4-hydroxy-tetrahydrodipicolinate reductase
MGRLTIGIVNDMVGAEIGGLYAPGHDGEDIGGHRCSADPDVLAGCDIVLEFTNPQAADVNVARWHEYGGHVVVGTSGYTPERIEALRAHWTSSTARCLIVPNFAVGAVLMMRFAELAAPHVESVEIIETHHEDKPDAPSGTALATAARVAAARARAGLGSHPDRGREIVAGALGADAEGIPVHSLRMVGTIAHQEVVMGAVGQYLTIRHDTTAYTAFSPGIDIAIRGVAGLQEGVTVGLEHLLGL